MGARPAPDRLVVGGRHVPPARPPAGSQPDHALPPAAGTARPDGRRPPRRRRRAVVLAAQARPRRRRHGRPGVAAATRRRGARTDVHQARPDHLVRRGLFPPELVDEFKRCRDQVPPEPFDVVRRTVEADLGRPLEDVFESFDVRPLAAASIAQVHAARLRSGEDVVVKVQRPESPDSCTTTCGRWRGWRRTSSGASRSARWPTRRRSSSCSPTRSSRSSTSASRPPTCSTSQRCCASSSRPATSCPGRIRRSSPGACS